MRQHIPVIPHCRREIAVAELVRLPPLQGLREGGCAFEKGWWQHDGLYEVSLRIQREAELNFRQISSLGEGGARREVVDDGLETSVEGCSDGRNV